MTAGEFQNTDLEAIWEAINTGIVVTSNGETIATEKKQIITAVEVISSTAATLKTDINNNITTNPSRKYINISNIVNGLNIITIMAYTT
jgi:hypothetical protein